MPDASILNECIPETIFRFGDFPQKIRKFFPLKDFSALGLFEDRRPLLDNPFSKEALHMPNQFH